MDDEIIMFGEKQVNLCVRINIVKSIVQNVEKDIEVVCEERYKNEVINLIIKCKKLIMKKMRVT